jgi:hypothetical protein
MMCLTCYFCRYVKDADKEIIANIKAAGRLVDHASLNHYYVMLFHDVCNTLFSAGTSRMLTSKLGVWESLPTSRQQAGWWTTQA